MFKRCLTSFLALSFTPLVMKQENNNKDTKRHAICILYPNKSQVRGIISFSQDNENEATKIACSVRGLNPNSKNIIGIYQFGDLTQGENSAGSNYIPNQNKSNREVNQETNAKNMKVLISDPFGNAYMCTTDKNISLYGQYSILGRSIFIHNLQEDQSQLKQQTPKSELGLGLGLASGIIGISKQFKIVPSTLQ